MTTLAPHPTSATTIEIADRMRSIVIERSFPVKTGHIGSCLSVVDLLAVLFGGVMQRDEPGADRFVLSKGHAALALYGALHCVGALGAEDLVSYCADGSSVGEHPDHVVPGVEFSTGSLGFGLSLASGLALSAKMRHSHGRSFVLMSDAELDEGSIWEAVMFAAHHQLSSLVTLVDLNGQQAMGQTCDVLHLPRLATRWEAFGWDVHEVDGHDHDQLAAVLGGLDYAAGPPHVLLARTTFGKGVSFMEGQLGWHYWSMSPEHHAAARRELAENHDGA